MQVQRFGTAGTVGAFVFAMLSPVQAAQPGAALSTAAPFVVPTGPPGLTATPATCGGTGVGVIVGNMSSLVGAQQGAADGIVAFPQGDATGNAYMQTLQNGVSAAPVHSTGVYNNDGSYNEGRVQQMYQQALQMGQQGPNLRGQVMSYASLQSQGAFRCTGLASGMGYTLVATITRNATQVVIGNDGKQTRAPITVTRYYRGYATALKPSSGTVGGLAGGWQLIGQNPTSITASQALGTGAMQIIVGP